MWILSKHPKISGKSSEAGYLEFYLLEGREYIVGRKDCDIVIPGDVSVSRKHAIIRPLTQTKGSKDAPQIYLKDTSKTGTTVNGSKLDSSSKETHVKDGDILCFGKTQNKFKFSYVSINVLTSCVSSKEDKMKVKSIVKKLGGHVYSDWCDGVTHLVMGKLTFTMKVVNALAAGKPILSIKYLEDYFDCCDQKKGKKLPLPSEYLPVIAETNLRNKEYLLQPNDNRSSLFNGKLFVTLMKTQFERIKHAVELSGGKIILKESQDSSLFQKLSVQQTIVLNLESKDSTSATPQQRKWIDSVYKKVESHNLRTIRETEIGLAILNTSLQFYCNPAASEASNLSQVITDTMQLESTQLSQSQTQPVSVETTFREPLPIVTSAGSESEKEQEFHTDGKSKSCKERYIVEETQKLSTSRKRLNESTSDVTTNAKKKQKISVVEDSIDVKEEVDPFDQEINSFLEEEFLFDDQQNKNPLLIEPKKETNKFNRNNSFFVSDTVPSTAKMNQRTEPSTFLVSDTFAVSGKANNIDNSNPFDFDMDDFSVTSTSKNKIKEIIDNSLPDESLDIEKIQQEETKKKIVESRFLKAISSTQDSSESADFQVDVDNETVIQKRNQNIDPTPCVQTFPTPSNMLNKSDEAMTKRMSFDEEITPSEEFLPSRLISKKVSIKGFISVSNKQSPVVKKEDDSDLEGIDRDLIQIRHASLIVNPNQKQNKPVVSRRKVKNFKCFRKQIVKGSHVKNSKKIDLMVYEGDNVQQDSLFREFREEIDREDEEKRKDDRLFNWGSQ